MENLTNQNRIFKLRFLSVFFTNEKTVYESPLKNYGIVKLIERWKKGKLTIRLKNQKHRKTLIKLFFNEFTFVNSNWMVFQRLNSSREITFCQPD